MESSFAESLREFREDARKSVRIREHLRFYAINKLDKNDVTREDMLILRMVERMDARYPLGKHAHISASDLSRRAKSARDEQPVKGLEDPWKTRLEMLGNIMPGSVLNSVEPEMNIRRLRQLLGTWTVYQSFSETLADSYNTFRDKEKVLRARAEDRIDRLPARLRREWLETDLGV